MKARQIFLSTAIDGLDLHKGFELYHENVVVFTKILRTFTLNMHTMLMSMDIDGDFSISDYRIKVHGIKGACYTIFAEQISKMANRLEDAAESGDVDYIRQHHAPFIQATTQLINEMDKMLAVVDAINPKPIKDKPDRQALAKLREACEDFDMLRADDIMTEIEGYQYTADDGLTLWLSENVALTNLTEVAAKLENLDY
jgi:HPt (histidine-containing phosphotransfer) domain-containing protein